MFWGGLEVGGGGILSWGWNGLYGLYGRCGLFLVRGICEGEFGFDLEAVVDAVLFFAVPVAGVDGALGA